MQDLKAGKSQDMTAVGEVSDAERPVSSVTKRLASETHVDQVFALDMVGNLTEKLCRKRE